MSFTEIPSGVSFDLNPLHPYFGSRTETPAKRRSFFKQSPHGRVSIAADGSIETINIFARMSAIAETSLNLWMVIAKMARPRKSRGVIVSVDRQAPRIRGPGDDRIPLDAERRPHGFPEEKLSHPCFLKPFSASHAWTCRGQPHHPVAKRADRAARVLDIGFPATRRVQEGDLYGYALAGGGLKSRNHAGKGALRLRSVVAVRWQIADCRGWVRRKTAPA